MADLKPREDLSQFDPKQVAMGKRVEREHTTNPEVALTITSHHLEEDPKYYTKLDKMEHNKMAAFYKAAVADMVGQIVQPHHLPSVYDIGQKMMRKGVPFNTAVNALMAGMGAKEKFENPMSATFS
jgi:hypothetical protein